MKAVKIEKNGGPEVLKIKEITGYRLPASTDQYDH